MPCLPTYLGIDMALWYGVFETLVQSNRNVSDGDPWDCGLTIAPCDSNITKALIIVDPTFIFWFDLVVVYVILTSVVILGLIGNISNIVIFSKYNIATDSTNYFLLGLSVSDLLNIIANGLALVGFYMCWFDSAMAVNAHNMVETRVFSITRWLSLLSLDIVTVISTQRAAAVVLPFKVASIFSIRNTNIIIALLVILCFCTIIPVHLTLDFNWVFHPYFEKYIFMGNVLKFDSRFIITYITTYYNCRSVCDLLLIFVAGSVTVYKLKQQARNRATLKADASTSGTTTVKRTVGETRVIKLSLTVCCVTFLIHSIVIAVNGIVMSLAEQLYRTNIPTAAEYISKVLQSINSCFNFFVYLGMSRRYRNIFKNCFIEKR